MTTDHRSLRPITLTLALVAVLALALALTACGQEPQESANTQVLFMSYDADPATWDPSAAASTESQWLANVYEPLLWANAPGSAEAFTPALATSWEVSEDGLTWTFKLREGVKFHDGTPFDAAAVKYSINRTRKLGQGYAYIWADVNKITVIDDYTVSISTNNPTTLDRVAAAGYGAWIFSPASKGQDQKWWDAPNSAGSGPYKIVSYKPNEEIRFEANEDYWGGWEPSKYKTVVFRFVKEATSSRQMLEAGDIDIIPSVTQDVASGLESSETVDLVRKESFQTWQVALNTQREPLNDVRVRQAMSYAIPYDDLIQVAEQGQAKQARGPLPSGLWPWSESVPQYTYDLEKAKQLMAEAGYASGGIELLFTILSDYGNEKVAAQLIKESLAEIGIDVTIREMLWNQMWNLAKTGPGGKAQDMYFCVQWPSYPDGFDVLMIGYYTQDPWFTNVAYYSNPEVDGKIDEAHKISATDPEGAKALYVEVQNQIAEDAPYLFLYDSQAVAAYDSTIKGVALNPNYPTVLNWYSLSQ